MSNHEIQKPMQRNWNTARPYWLLQFTTETKGLILCAELTLWGDGMKRTK